MRDLPKIKLDLNKPEEFGNVAEKLSPEERRTLAADIIALVAVDEGSMSDWLGKAKGYLAKLENDDNENPQEREQEGSNEEPPPQTELTLTAVIQFSARASDALLGEPELVRASEPDVNAEKLAEWVSSQFRTKDKHWVLDTDPLAIHMSVTGLSWRKRDFDDLDRVFHSHFLPCTDVIINASVRSVERAPRITHQFERYPYEIERSIQRKKWVDYEPVYDEKDPQAPKKFYETDLWMDLDDDGYDEPWTVTISRDDTPEVVRIRPRWSRKTIVNTDAVLFFNAIHRFYPYRFLPDPKGDFLPMGFGRLLDRVESSADQLLGNIVDTAKSEAENGGIMAGGQFGLPEKVELKNNRITTVNTDGMPLEKAFSAFPSKSVSAGSVAVLEKVITLADRIAGTLNTLENAPASMTATLAKGLIDNGMQVQSAVHRRMVVSMTQEAIMFVQMADAYDMLPEGIMAASADGIAVTADPQMATEMQRTAAGAVFMEMIQQPHAFNVQEAALRFCKVMRFPMPEKLVAPPQQPQATPKEKMQGLRDFGKLHLEKIKVTGTVAVQLTQALKNMVDASGGMLDNRTALLQMAQLEQAVQGLMESAASANSAIDGMAESSGDGSAGNVSQVPAGGAGGVIPPGAPGITNGAGPGGGGQ